ncbi:MAG: DNA-binding LytR/AlgR family response regulator, partial [Flavobacteriales bacterium]
GNKLKKIIIPEISNVRVEGKYSCITISEHTYYVKISLADLVTKLPTKTFTRVSRNYVVNLEMITDIDLQEQVVVVAGIRISFSRNYRDNLMKQIDLI